MYSYSNELFQRAQTVIPGGVNSPVRTFKAVGGNPVFFKKGQGPYLFDCADKPYLDFSAAFGPHILGHAHPKVVKAVQNTAQNGLGFGTPTEQEVEIAELVTQYMPSIEKLRLVSSGTEASQSAIRLARGYTHRNKIVKFEGCYHGHVDSLLVQAGSGCSTFSQPNSAGVPQSFTEHTILLPFNNFEAIEQCFSTYGEDIAGVIIEPVAGNMNCILPQPHFLSTLRQLCSQYESLLIFDEVITGFRLGLGGAQAWYDIKPDLTCLGKILGGGLPIGGFGGRKEIMENLSPNGPVYQAGTNSGNPVCVAAGLATLRELQKPQLYETLLNNTQYFVNQLLTLAQHYSVPLQISYIGSMFGMYFSEVTALKNYEDIKKGNADFFAYFFKALLKENIYISPSHFEINFISTAHEKTHLDIVLEIAEKIFKAWELI